MPLWIPEAINEEPEIGLRFWRVYELPDSDRHLVGYNPSHGGEGRVSSRIKEFDAKTQKAKTRSGRVYHLDGSPSFHPDADYVWNNWLSIFKISKDEVKDVTLEVWEEVKPHVS